MAKIQRRIQPVALKDVTFERGFWDRRRRLNREISLLDQYAKCKSTGRIDALNLKRKGVPRHIYWDSDVAKWVEGAAYSLITHPDKSLENNLNKVVDLFIAAQQPDGYINSYFTAEAPKKRWTNLCREHELYQAGHMIEAAIAHWKATGKRNFLEAVERFSDYIATVFGRGKGKKRGYPGHQEIELALVKLYRVTGNKKYLRLGKYFLDERGRQPHYFDREARSRGEGVYDYRDWEGLPPYTNAQAHLPVREQTDARGHAVRGLYLYSAMADVAAETDDAELFAACRKLWDSVTKKQMYLTGGVGQQMRGEGFDVDYNLPNDLAYAETCAAIALVFFAHRMLQINPRGEYADVMERALYNGIISCVGLDGKSYFYSNPLADRAGVNMCHHEANTSRPYVRSAWFDTSCCPSNLGRILASLGQYVYSINSDSLYVHLYAAGKVNVEFHDNPVTLQQKTNYPWDGEVKLAVEPSQPTRFKLFLRIPGWCRSHSIKVNGRKTPVRIVKGYAVLQRTWSAGDVVELNLKMPVERIVAHPKVAADGGKVALQRGPIVYCLEQCDHKPSVHSIVLPDTAKLTPRFETNLLGGCVTITGKALAPTGPEWNKSLYRFADTSKRKATSVMAIPYALWCNRTPGDMVVWLGRNSLFVP